MQPDEKMKGKIVELKNYLNNEVIPDDLQSETVLEISRELDILILEFYTAGMEEKEASTF